MEDDTLNTLRCVFGEAEEAGMDVERLGMALGLIDGAVDSGFIPGFAAAVYRNGAPMCIGHGGARNPANLTQPVERDTIFLIASLTKPIVCAGALMLLEKGMFSLNQPVREFIPEFRDGLKDEVKLIHLFTHTSGLYDQIPRGVELRRSQAPIDQYVRAVCDTDLLFTPGTRVSYQSMGILLIGEIVERITGQRLRDHLRQQLFEPLEMNDTTLGMPTGGMTRAAYSLDAPFPADSNDVGDDWDTDYWRDLGAPWGGLHSTVDDLSHFLSHMLGQRQGPLSPALRAAMTTDQLPTMANIPEADRRTNRWGLGWRLGSRAFGNLVSRDSFGHTGATGAMFWADPAMSLSCVLLTNQPRLSRNSPPGFEQLGPRFSNAVVAAIVADNPAWRG